MGKRGPKPKPTALMVFDGDPGHRLSEREGDIAPPSCAAIPPCPEWIGERGKEKWQELAPQLHAIGCLTGVDLDAFAIYCDAHDELHQAMKEIGSDGIILIGEKGGQYQHPAVGIKSNAIKRIRQFAGDFGMTPAARVGLKLGDSNKQNDELEDLKASRA